MLGIEMGARVLEKLTGSSYEQRNYYFSFSNLFK